MHSHMQKKILRTFFRVGSVRTAGRRRRRQSAVSSHHFNMYKEEARALVHARLVHWNTFYNHSYKRVAIRNQRSRWGSCSTLGNLNFNYKILFLSPELVDYIIVHELCHLQEFNHSKQFWDLVARALPEYATHKRVLRTVRMQSIHIE